MGKRAVLQVVVTNGTNTNTRNFSIKIGLGYTLTQLVEQIVAPKIGIDVTNYTYAGCVDSVPIFSGECIPNNAQLITIRFVRGAKIFQIDGGGKTILLVEPHIVLCGTLARILTGAGYRVIIAHTVDQGINKLREIEPQISLVITAWFNGKGDQVIQDAVEAGLPFLIATVAPTTLPKARQLCVFNTLDYPQRLIECVANTMH